MDLFQTPLMYTVIDKQRQDNVKKERHVESATEHRQHDSEVFQMDVPIDDSISNHSGSVLNRQGAEVLDALKTEKDFCAYETKDNHEDLTQSESLPAQNSWPLPLSDGRHHPQVYGYETGTQFTRKNEIRGENVAHISEVDEVALCISKNKHEMEPEEKRRRMPLRRRRNDTMTDLPVHFGTIVTDDDSVSISLPVSQKLQSKRKQKSNHSKGKKAKIRERTVQNIEESADKSRSWLCKVDISREVMEQWRHIGRQTGLGNDSDIAALLVQHYQDTGCSRQCGTCHSPLRLLCCRCPLPSPSPVCLASTLPTKSVSVSSPSVFRPSLSIPFISEPSLSISEVSEPSSSISGISKPSPPVSAISKPSPSISAISKPSLSISAISKPSPSIPSSPPRQLTVEESDGEEDGVLETTVPTEPEPFITVKLPSKPRRRRGQGQQAHICTECGSQFARAGGLKVHMRTHTGEKPFTCSECSQSFSTSGQLTNHLRKHSGERPFVCTVCSATFPVAGSLKQHMRKHTGDKPYSCQICQQRFSYRGDLTAHERKHTGDRPFLCSDCGKSFSMSSHLSKHRRIHSSHRPFVCSVCHKGFPFLNRLTLHMRTHTGEKPFLCADCGTSFTRASTLTIHRRIHHTFEKPCVCPFCHHAFADSANLSKHKKYKHGVNRTSV